MVFFDTLEQLPNDPILSLTSFFMNDPRSTKINLGVGSYKNSEGLPVVLKCVSHAEQMILEQNLNKEYPPIEGDKDYIKGSIRLIFGDEYDCAQIFGAQTLGGTGALHVGGEFLVRNKICNRIFLSNPTWSNHYSIFRNAGLAIETYPYYDSGKNQIDFSAMCAFIQTIPEGSAILFQPCCHNPTGIDPAIEQWAEIAALVKRKRLLPFFDLAYQGLDQGIQQDCQVIKLFANTIPEFLVASSYSKNLGLYGERVGHLAIVCKSTQNVENVGSQIRSIIRGNYSMPPLQGQRIVTTILNSGSLREQWEKELGELRERIQSMRALLFEKLFEKGVGEQFQFLKNQTGMFSFSSLNPEQVNKLKSQFGIYMPSNGRINVAGLNTANLDYFIDALLSVIKFK